jgi:hypothetical protein
LRLIAEASIDSVSASVDFTMGAKLDVPSDSIAKLDVQDGSKNQLSGWIPTFTPVPPELKAEIDVKGHIGPRVNLELDLQFLKTGIGAGLSLAAPQLTLDLSASGNTGGGICQAENVNAGVSVDVGLGAELDVFGGFGKAADLPGKAQLFTTNKPLFSTCLPIGAGATSTTAAPAGPTGQSTTFLNDNCDPAESGSNSITEGACVDAGFDTDFQSGNVFFPLLDQGNGCFVEYYSDKDCANQVGPVRNAT